MADVETVINTKQQKRMIIDGHRITISFAESYNPGLEQLVKNSLIDSFLRANGISDVGKHENDSDR